MAQIARPALSPAEAAVRRGRLKFVPIRELERWLDESAVRTLDAS